MSRQYASPLLLRISRSKTYRNLMLVMFGLSALSIYLIINSIGILSIFLFALLIYTTVSALNNNRKFELHWQQNNSWMISRHHELVSAKLCDSSFITSFLSILNFRFEDGFHQSILIFKDNIDAESFRRLRVRVKVQGINSQAHDIIKQ